MVTERESERIDSPYEMAPASSTYVEAREVQATWEPENMKKRGAENADCGCSTLVGLSAYSGMVTEAVMITSLLLNLYLATIPPMFWVVEMGWLKALLESKGNGNPREDRLERERGTDREA